MLASAADSQQAGEGHEAVRDQLGERGGLLPDGRTEAQVGLAYLSGPRRSTMATAKSPK